MLTLSRTRHSYKEGNVFYAGSVSVGCVYPQARLKIPTFRSFWREIVEWSPEIVHSQCEFSTFFPAKRIAERLGIPLIHTYHTIYEDYTHYFSPARVWGRELVQIMTRRVSRQVSEMIAPSEKIRSLLEGYQVACPVSVVPSGIDLERYRPTKDADGSRQELRRRLWIPEEKTVLVYVGRLAKEKNIGELLDFQMEAQKEETVLLIVGDGPYRRTLQEQAERNGITETVRFTGMVSPEQVAGYYQAGDLFVSASRSETQGMTYAEALACGLPLLCRRDECLGQVIREGENGWQYENQEGFLSALRQWKGMCEDEKRKISRAAAGTAELFSSGGFAGRMEQIYRERIRDRLCREREAGDRAGGLRKREAGTWAEELREREAEERAGELREQTGGAGKRTSESGESFAA